jgi:hypothetical protein
VTDELIEVTRAVRAHGSAPDLANPENPGARNRQSWEKEREGDAGDRRRRAGVRDRPASER